MNIKRFLLIGFETIVVFAIVWLLVQLPEIKQNVNLNRNIGLHYEWYGFLNDQFWQDIILLILSFGTSMLFWKRQSWRKLEKARYLCIFSGMFSFFSLLIIVAAIRTDSQNFWLFGLLMFLITSILVTTVIHYITLQLKYIVLESLKIIFLGLIASAINIFSNLFVTRPYHGGDTGTAVFFIFLFILSVVITFITSLSINFTLLKKKLRRKI